MFEQILIDNRGLFIAICVPLIGAYFAVHVHERNRFSVAADKFRSTILAELKGLYPVNGFWPQEEYHRFQKSIPTIKKAAVESRPALPFYRKCRFDKAIAAYCGQCQNMKWDKAVTDVVFSDEVKTTQKEQFVKCVNHLLSFTK